MCSHYNHWRVSGTCLIGRESHDVSHDISHDMSHDVSHDVYTCACKSTGTFQTHGSLEYTLTLLLQIHVCFHSPNFQCYKQRFVKAIDRLEVCYLDVFQPRPQAD